MNALLKSCDNATVSQLFRASMRVVFLCSLFLAYLGINAHADSGQHKIPGIERGPSKYSVPEHLDSLSTEEVASIRKARHEDLEDLRSGANSEEVSEQYMFEQLMAHDEVRLTITEVIPKLIEDYEIDGKFKKTLMGYRSTFTDEIMQSREHVEDLQDYQSYDFRFTAVYMSMLFAFQEHPEFYEQLKKDMVDNNTTIGKYRKSLDDSYGRVSLAKEQMDVVHSAEDLEDVIDALDEELARRDD